MSVMRSGGEFRFLGDDFWFSTCNEEEVKYITFWMRKDCYYRVCPYHNKQLIYTSSCVKVNFVGFSDSSGGAADCS